MSFSRTYCRADRLLVWLLVGWWVVNLLQASFTQLANDEAYYWLFARNPAWGYFDHPPVTAWLVWAGGFMGGELGIRFFFTLLQPAYLYIIWRLVRPSHPRTEDASLFFVISAAMPILQLYGFIAVPDGPLMFFTALFLLAYKRFRERNTIGAAVAMGAVMAALAYSKYHGALVVGFALLSDPRNFRNPKLYLSAVVTLLLLTPHLWWQYDHDWASFRYHLSGRNGYFRWSDLGEFLMNLLVIFNPLFVPLYVRGWGRDGGDAQYDVRRALYVMTVGFIIFFTVSSFRGYVQPQWVIPVAFGLIMVLFGYARRNRRTERYVRISGWITVGLACAVRLIMIFNPFGIRFEVFDNPESYGTIAKATGGRPVIFDGGYAQAAKYVYYTGGEAYSQGQVGYRTSQWEYIDADTPWAGREVAIAVPSDRADSTITLPNGKRFSWRIEKDFRPARKAAVEITSGAIPPQAAPGDTLRFGITVRNPYDYSIDLGTPPVRLVFAIGQNKRDATQIEVPLKITVPAGNEASAEATVIIPPDMPERTYNAGLTVRVDGMPHWYNGRQYKLKIRNPDVHAQKR